MTHYAYRHIRTTGPSGPFEQIIDYLIDVPLINASGSILYFLRLYRYSSFLYISDIFPQEYESDQRCFKRFTSHEGKAVDMWQLSVSGVRVFFETIAAADNDAVFVVSGSYQDGEEEKGQSRKLRIYRFALRQLCAELNLRTVEMPEQNAFFLTTTDCRFSEQEIKQIYLNFKTTKQ
ncbi:MAG TPA: hypothetical protein DEO38_01835 [Bacteroidales bacterium]|nr:hypothetical protein [Bacteroidales bacterium]